MLDRLTSPPPVLAALKVDTALLPLVSVVPPTELVVRSLPTMKLPPASAIVEVEMRLTLPAPASMSPPTTMAPVLEITTLPPPLSLISVSVKGAAVLVRRTSPLVVFVALKLETVLAPFLKAQFQ